MTYYQDDYSPVVFISSNEDLKSEIITNDIGHEFLFLKKQVYCPECDEVLKKSFIVEAKAQAYAEKHTGYKKYSTHNPIVRDIDYDVEFTIADIKGSDANIKKIQSLREIVYEKEEQAKRIKNQEEERELLPQIEKISKTLGIEYTGMFNNEHGRPYYGFDTYFRHSQRQDSTTIRITFDQIVNEHSFGDSQSMFRRMQTVAFYLTGEHYNAEQLSRAFPNANYGELTLEPVLVTSQ